MNLKPIANLVTSKVGRQVLKLRKHSPAILFVGGIVGVVGTTVLASRATLKVDDILTEAQDDLGKVRALEDARYTEQDRQRDTAIIYVRTSVKIAKLYAPAIGLGVLSIAALSGSHIILSKRNAAITAAYAALDKGFRAYRDRVAREYGPEQEAKFRFDSEEVSEVDPETKKVKTVDQVVSSNGSIYARCFDQTNQNWNGGPNRYNQMFLSSQQQYANDKLRSQGHLFLNEVYDMLGMERSSAGSVVGWVWDPANETYANYVDFGVFAGNRDEGMRFVRGYENSIWLDFNVDGLIWDKI